MIEINKNYNESNLETMAKMPDCFVDLTITSPPYDNLRTYENEDYLTCGEFEDMVKELWRITKDGGVVVWIVGDSVKNGNESGTSFYHALTFKKYGWNLFDTMIYFKNGGLNSGANNSYIQKFEYMFVFSKGKIKTTNIIEDRLNEHTKPRKKKKRNTDGTFRIQEVLTKEQGKIEYFMVDERKCDNLIQINALNSNEQVGYATQKPKALIERIIKASSNEGDLVADFYMGSGTTAEVCKDLNRNFIGCDINPMAVEITLKRLNDARS